MSARDEPIFVLSERDLGVSDAGARSSRSALTGAHRSRLLIFLVAYHAESTVGRVLTRIPNVIAQEYDVEVLVIDDASTDETVKRAADTRLTFPMTVLSNPVNLGYGGNQKVGYRYALEHGFDFVALLHADGQYAPECLPELLRPLQNGSADACFGSRLMNKGGARRGGMPLYKLWGNRILSWFENRMLRTSLSEFHSGYRVYSVAALRQIPLDLNTNDFHFDTEIIIQLVTAGLRIVELPIPTYYGDEICRVNGMKYAWNVACAVLKARAQEYGLFYDRRFDCGREQPNAQYKAKLNYSSPHSLTLRAVPAGSRVLDLACASGYLAAALKQQKQCRVVGIDLYPPDPAFDLDGFHQHDLNRGLPDLRLQDFDRVLLLDIIEHLSDPERFVEQLREALKFLPDVKLMVSTGNIGFLLTRFALLFGKFNYGKRGILDRTHTRLFTFATLRRLFEQGGFRVVEMKGVPGPYPLALGDCKLSRFLLRLNEVLIRISKGLFAYQIYMIVQPYPSTEYLLQIAREHFTTRPARQVG
jgi:glycosyltransferase involved in cell wall biosynthesis